MEKRIMLWIVIGILFLGVLFLTFKVSTLSNSSTSNAGAGNLDTSGWTQNEIMNYQMHGIVPSRVSAGSTGAATASSGAGQVGGC